jgi:hypothetical protein
MTGTTKSQDPAGNAGATTPADPAGLTEALAYLRGVRAEATDARLTVAPVVVRDVLLTSHHRGSPCWQGKKQVLSKQGTGSDGAVRGIYRNCGGGKCPRCVVGYLDRAVRQCWRVWGEADIYDTSLTEKEWDSRERTRTRTILRDYSGRYLRVLKATGGVVIFTPGPVEGSVPVENGNEVAAALLAAPANGRRYTLPKRTVEMKEEDNPAKPEHERWHTVTLERDTPLRDALRAVEQALGLRLDWQALDASRMWWRAFEATGLTPEQIEVAREALEPYRAAISEDVHIRAAIARGSRRRREQEELRALEEEAA